MAASRTRYTTVAIVIHWLIAAAIVFQIILGWRMGDGPKGSPTTFALFQLHKSIGITILLLSLARLAWRLFNKPPAADKSDIEVRAITAEDRAPAYLKLRVERMNVRMAGARKKAAAEKK